MRGLILQIGTWTSAGRGRDAEKSGWQRWRIEIAIRDEAHLLSAHEASPSLPRFLPSGYGEVQIVFLGGLVSEGGRKSMPN